MLRIKRVFSIVLGVLLLAVNVTAVVAAPPEPIHIEVTEFPDSWPTNHEPFVATGLAVDHGLVCATGTVLDLNITSNQPSGPFLILWVDKRFTCDDLSSTFDVTMVVKLDLATNNTTARWRIVGGTGQYAGLKGRGSLVGTSNLPAEPSILDVYDGKVH